LTSNSTYRFRVGSMELLTRSELVALRGADALPLGFYEAIGMLEPAAGQPGSEVLYECTAVERLAFGDWVMRLGAPPAEMAGLWTMWSAGDRQRAIERLAELLDLTIADHLSEAAELVEAAEALDQERIALFERMSDPFLVPATSPMGPSRPSSVRSRGCAHERRSDR
jgi:DNA-binding transcriptional MerR regulator